MEKQIIGTLFVLFMVFSFVLFTDVGVVAELLLGAGATLVAMCQLVDGEVE